MVFSCLACLEKSWFGGGRCHSGSRREVELGSMDEEDDVFPKSLLCHVVILCCRRRCCYHPGLDIQTADDISPTWRTGVCLSTGQSQQCMEDVFAFNITGDAM